MVSWRIYVTSHSLGDLWVHDEVGFPEACHGNHLSFRWGGGAASHHHPKITVSGIFISTQVPIRLSSSSLIPVQALSYLLFGRIRKLSPELHYVLDLGNPRFAIPTTNNVLLQFKNLYPPRFAPDLTLICLIIGSQHRSMWSKMLTRRTRKRRPQLFKNIRLYRLNQHYWSFQ